MDFLDFEGQSLYFDESVCPEAEALIHKAAAEYSSNKSESYLHQAFFLAPENLSVHVALYRYYFYKHQLEKAIHVANITLKIVGAQLGLPENWQQLTKAHLGISATKSMGLLRYYFLGLKASGYLHIRIGDTATGIAMLSKVSELDSADRLGAKALLEVVKDSNYDAVSSNYYAH